MEKERIQFREEEDVAGFLVVQIEHVTATDGTKEIHLTQKGLTERIIAAMNLDGADILPVEVPATSYLPKDENGKPTESSTIVPSLVN